MKIKFIYFALICLFQNYSYVLPMQNKPQAATFGGFRLSLLVTELEEEDDTLQLSVGVSANLGRRDQMEDTYDIQKSLHNDRFAFCAVYDGATGYDPSSSPPNKIDGLMVATMVRDQLCDRIFQNIGVSTELTCKQIQDAIKKAYVDVDITMPYTASGTTANVVLFDKKEKIIYCGNLGDSRAILSSKGQVIQLSRDHKAIDPIEIALLLNAGCRISGGRLDGINACSRAFGFGDRKSERTALAEFMRTAEIGIYPGGGRLCFIDACSRGFGFGDRKDARPALAELMRTPEIGIYQDGADVDFVIIASDGLWDVMTNAEAANFVATQLRAHHGDAQQAACELVNHAIDQPIGVPVDNVTAIVVVLR